MENGEMVGERWRSDGERIDGWGGLWMDGRKF